MATTTTPQAVCTRIAEQLAEVVGPHRYNMWFDRSARLDYHDEQDQLRIAVPNEFVADWIGRNFSDHLRRVAANTLGKDVNLDVQVEPERFARGGAAPREEAKASETSDAAPSHPNRPSTGPERVRLMRDFTHGEASSRSLRYRLDDFVVGPNTELAHSAATRLAEETDSPLTHALFIFGGCGTGKTHLLQGACHAYQQQHPNARVHYTTGEQFTNDYVAAVRGNRLDSFRRRMRRLDMLAVDDVQFLATRTKTQQEFQHTFDALEMAGARIMLSAHEHPRRINQFAETLISRCMRGMVVEIRDPDTDTRVRIVRALAQRKGISLLETVCAMLASRCRGSVREIEGTLTKLHALARLNRERQSNGKANGHNVVDEPIGHSVASQLFSTGDASRPRRAIRVDQVLDVVCRRLEVAHGKVTGGSRHRRAVLARSIVAYLSKELTGMSYPEIAAALGRKSHSTIVTARARLEAQLGSNDPQLVTLPETLEQLPLPTFVEQVREELEQAR